MTVLFLSLSVLFCSKGGDDRGNGTTTLSVWETYNNEEHSLFMELIHEFENRHPDVRFSVQRIPFTGADAKILSASATRSTPDIARVDCAMVTKLAARNAIVPIDTWVDPQHLSSLNQAALSSNRWNNKLYGLPDQVTGAALFYNKALFRNAGLDPEKPPKDWDQFIETAKRLTDPSKGVYGFGMRNSLWWTFPFFSTFGATFLKEIDGRRTCALHEPEGIRALQFKVDLYQKHAVEAGAWRAGAINPDTGFQNQKYAMVLNGPWKLKNLENSGMEFGVTLIPEGPAGTATNVGGTNMVIFRTCENRDIACTFLEYLTSSKSQALWAEKLGQIPVNLDSYPMIGQDVSPHLKTFMEQMKRAVPRPNMESYDEIENAINPEMEAALTGKLSVKNALKRSAEKINRILREEDERLSGDNNI
jgi:multiple sugar transport system substrate-binding protein